MKALKFIKKIEFRIDDFDGKIIFTENDIDEVREAIAELEALQQRSCESCKHGEYHDETTTYCKEYVREKTFNLANPNDFYCKHFKPKEQ